VATGVHASALLAVALDGDDDRDVGAATAVARDADTTVGASLEGDARMTRSSTAPMASAASPPAAAIMLRGFGVVGLNDESVATAAAVITPTIGGLSGPVPICVAAA
jgi:hypothetical protein